MRRHGRAGPLLVHAPAHDGADDPAQRHPVPHPKRIRLAQRLPDRGIAGGRPPIGPDEHVAKQHDAVPLVHAEAVANPWNVLWRADAG